MGADRGCRRAAARAVSTLCESPQERLQGEAVERVVSGVDDHQAMAATKVFGEIPGVLEQLWYHRRHHGA